MSIQTTSDTVKPKRLLSVDALRGFDMVWIMGAEGLFAALFLATGLPLFERLAAQMEHAQWHGMTAYDLIFPLFIFLSGVSIGIAAKPIKSLSNDVQKQQYKHAIKRLILLLLLGVVYNHGWGQGIPVASDDVRYASVLGRIGIAWFVAIMLVWHCSVRVQWVVSIGILLSYWLLLTFASVGEYGGGNLTPTGALNVWVDQLLLPGTTYQQRPMDPEGILSNIPSIVNAMAGVFVGRHMKLLALQPTRLISHLLISSLVMITLGYIWAQFFPLNKSLWTSSFVLVTCGYSTLLLALFYWVIDVLEWQTWAKWFSIIGMNSIVIYVSGSVVNWPYTSHSVFGGLTNILPYGWSEVASVVFLVAIQWFFLYWLYRRKIFIKV